MVSRHSNIYLQLQNIAKEQNSSSISGTVMNHNVVNYLKVFNTNFFSAIKLLQYTKAALAD